jgi:hypothetical protein
MVDKIDLKDSFYEAVEHVLNKFHKYHMKILLGDFNAKVGREDIFKTTIGNESLHEIRICHYKGPGKSGGTELNRTHQLLVYVDDVNLLADNIDTIKKHTKLRGL